jgi:hypothetical protein
VVVAAVIAGVTAATIGKSTSPKVEAYIQTKQASSCAGLFLRLQKIPFQIEHNFYVAVGRCVLSFTVVEQLRLIRIGFAFIAGLYSFLPIKQTV